MTIENPNLENDLHKSILIQEKVKDDTYAQSLYAALCNNEFQLIINSPNNMYLTIKSKNIWSCSWRHAGSIVSNIRNNILKNDLAVVEESLEDYMNYYCSGIAADDNINYRYIEEGVITPEIKEDLLTLGWKVI